MSEKLTTETLSEPETLLTIVERQFRDTHAPTDINAYHAERLARIAENRPTWVVRNFEAEQGRIYDFYNNHRIEAYIEEDDSGCVAVSGLAALHDEPVPLGKAIIDVEALHIDS